MAENRAHDLGNLHLKAKLPTYIRFGAVILLVVTAAAIFISYYRARNPEFRMKGFPTTLSSDVTATIEGYERREMEGDVVKYYIKADRATTFSDNHQELDNVFLQVFDPNGETYDQITAVKAVYVPEENIDFTAYFSGQVDINTRDGLIVKTEQVTYKKATETAFAEEQINFERGNIKGTALGSTVKIQEKQIELLQNVVIDADEPENAKVSRAKLTAGYALYDQTNEKIELRNNMTANIKSNDSGRVTDIHADRANVFLVEREGGRDVSKAELFDNVRIASGDKNGKPAKISAGYAMYQKPIDRFDLRGSVNIVTVEDDKPTTIKAENAVYEQSAGKIALSDGAEVDQGPNVMKGDQINAQLNAAQKLKNVHVKGNGYLKQVSPERVSEVLGPELTAAFNDSQQLSAANARGRSTAVITPSNAAEYAKLTMIAASAIDVSFRGEGLLEKMQTSGRTTIQLDAAPGTSDAANKRVTADAVNTFFNESGKDLRRAEAVGNAELFVDPLKASTENYQTTITAPRFDCEFYPTGNNARSCSGAVKTRTVRTPTVAGRSAQVLTSDKLNAHFSEATKDIEMLEAVGDAKFVEADRNAIADTMVFSAADQTVRLRGGEPTLWDSAGRAKAAEIDWNTKEQHSFLKGGVSTTYYSQKQTSGSAPFGETNKPVFITADAAEVDHRSQVAVYTGNARAWQEDNYVRGDKLTMRQQQAEFQADGNVQSLLYDATRRENGRETTVPVNASAAKMTYNRDTRKLRYETGVDIRQGTDRLTGSAADVYLSEKNEVARTDVSGNVVITQPQRKATADFAQYNASDESVILKGDPARVSDAESGSTQGSNMTIFLKDNRVINTGSKGNSASGGRTRTVYKVNNN